MNTYSKFVFTTLCAFATFQAKATTCDNGGQDKCVKIEQRLYLAQKNDSFCKRTTQGNFQIVEKCDPSNSPNDKCESCYRFDMGTWTGLAPESELVACTCYDTGALG